MPTMNAATVLPTLPDPTTIGQDFERDGVKLGMLAESYSLRTIGDLQDVVLRRAHIGSVLTKIDEFFEPLTSMAFKLHRALTARRNVVRRPWERADAVFATAMQRFKAEQDRIRRLEEAQLATERRRQEEAHAAAEAAALEQAGEPELAQATLALAIAAPPPVVTLPDVTKGIATFRTVWRWKYVGDSQEAAMRLLPREYCQPCETKITKVVSALKDQAKIPGIVVWKDEVPIR